MRRGAPSRPLNAVGLAAELLGDLHVFDPALSTWVDLSHVSDMADPTPPAWWAGMGGTIGKWGNGVARGDRWGHWCGEVGIEKHAD